jgi:hypothetical protein
VDPRAGLDDVEKRKFLTLPGLELSPLVRRVRSQSLYRPSYRGKYNGAETHGLLKGPQRRPFCDYLNH